MGWKYVMLQNKLAQYPIIFPDKLVHIEVATVMRLLIPSVGRLQPMPISAGMIEQLFVKGVGGESETLKMVSRPIDERIINLYNYEHGIR